MRETIRFLAALLITIMIFSVPACALPEGGQTDPSPAYQRMEIELEGMTEYIDVTQYIYEGSFSVWYDAVKFRPVPAETGVKFESIENKLSGEVSFSILDISESDRTDRPALEGYQQEYELQGWTIQALDSEGVFPRLSSDEGSVKAFLARKGTDLAQVCLVPAPRGIYLCALLYPEEAAEGWGARMSRMLSTLEELPEQ